MVGSLLRLACPVCGYSKPIRPGRIPEGRSRATCPRCRSKFDFGLTHDRQGLPEAWRLEAVYPHPKRAGKTVPGPMRPPVSGAVAPRHPRPVEPVQPPPAPSLKKPTPPPVPAPKTQPRKQPPQTRRPQTGKKSGPSRVPWEKGSGTRRRDYWSTWRLAMFSPQTIFAQPQPQKATRSPLQFAVSTLFYLVLLAAAIAGTALFLSPEFERSVSETQVYYIIGSAMAILILSRLLLSILIFFNALFLHLYLFFLRLAGGGFTGTLRVASYAHAPAVLLLVPLLGYVLAPLWSLVILVIGLKTVHHRPAGRMFVAVLIYPVILAVLASIAGGMVAEMLNFQY